MNIPIKCCNDNCVKSLQQPPYEIKFCSDKCSHESSKYQLNHEIICPYCDNEFLDSWELSLEDEKEEEIECGDCGAKFLVIREIEVTYSSRRILS